MIVLVTGGTGFIGQALGKRLAELNHQIIVVSRKNSANLPYPAKIIHESEIPQLKTVDAVIHLAGESIAQRWTEEAKLKIENSRTLGAERLIKALSQLETKPKVYIATSAIGFYGDRGNEDLDENSKKGFGFLSDICQRVEDINRTAAHTLKARTVIFRTGMVLGKNGGALEKMIKPFKLGLGGPVGDGKQWMSWIHIEDLVGMFVWALENSSAEGIYNGVSPKPYINKEFTQILASALNKPAKVIAPKFALRLLLGEMSQLVTTGQKVMPKRILNTNFHYNYSELREALRNIVGA